MWAISAETGKTVWKHEQHTGVMSLVATGGGLVFGGDVAGNFNAYDDKTGEVLWETDLGSPVSGYPITFAVGGKQYVAVMTGPSLVAATSRRVDAGAARRRRAAHVSSCSRCRSGTTRADCVGEGACAATLVAAAAIAHAARAPADVERHVAAAREGGGRRACRDGRPALPEIDAGRGAGRGTAPRPADARAAAHPTRRASAGTPSR